MGVGKGLWLCNLVLLLFLVLFPSLETTTEAQKKPYIVYLGRHLQTRDVAHLVDHEGIINKHHGFLASILGSKEKAHQSIFYSYTKFINGFAANLEKEEVAKLRSHPGVISVFPNRPRKLLTTHSWTFLGPEDQNGQIPHDSLWKKADFGKDVIIGVVDTGVWPESMGFHDDGMGPIPSRWRGKCETTGEVHCNSKISCNQMYNQVLTGYGDLCGLILQREW